MEDTGQTLEIEDVVLHPDYDGVTAYNDIAVIKLKTSNCKWFLNQYGLLINYMINQNQS